ncbi:hypothetical protein [Protofrankia symbiont of Coriaria ruscifolia]|uniref:hypothetical protein n=1 Tax=Protofrankia symbiont of Coriaria ruscifolia TaxID=1306542 RepID=UPI0010413623|nr:hypothetical protein [Protofrankia symbiont of Coriaria ruscifolia]
MPPGPRRMPPPPDAFHGFPDDTGAETFVREFPTAVAPVDRSYLMTKPTLFVLQVRGDGPEYDKRVRRVVEALRKPIDQGGKLVPYAELDAESGGPLLTEQAGDSLGFGRPRHMTPDRFPQFTLLKGVVHDIQKQGEGAGPDASARGLRDSAYAKRVQQGGLPAFLWTISGETPRL